MDRQKSKPLAKDGQMAESNGLEMGQKCSFYAFSQTGRVG